VATVALNAETLDRIQKLVLDTGDAATPEEAARIFSSYSLQVDVRADGLEGPTAEAAFATILNAAPRVFQGGVNVRLGIDPLLQTGWVAGKSASAVIRDYQCAETSTLSDRFPTLVLGSTGGLRSTHGPCLTIAHAGWAGGVTVDNERVWRGCECPLAGVAAGAIGISEAFQILRQNVRAGRRNHGISLWRPDSHWLHEAAEGPTLEGLLAPSRLHLLGLGHLGQGYIWALGWLPYGDRSAVGVVLQDVDRLTKANLATSLIARTAHQGLRKTRVAADALEGLGFDTSLIERRFDELDRVGADDPAVALVGVDNPQTRALLGHAGWRLIIDIGLGAGAGDYLDARLHAFPGDKDPAEVWGGRHGIVNEALLDQPAYQEIERRLGDRCGALMIAGRAVGAAFVGAFAGSLGITETLRYYADDETRFQLIDVTLRDLSRARVAMDSRWDGPDNLGYVTLAAP
jgi:hypothetical protein